MTGSRALAPHWLAARREEGHLPAADMEAWTGQGALELALGLHFPPPSLSSPFFL